MVLDGDLIVARWKAVATYRTAAGHITETHQIEELEDLQQLIEDGPAWNALVDIRIVYQHEPRNPTIEDTEEW